MVSGIDDPGCAGDADYPGRLDQFMDFPRNELGNMPLLMTELGHEPAVPVRIAKMLIMLRGSGTTPPWCQLPVWGNGPPPGEWSALDESLQPYPHARIVAWTAYWLGNSTRTSRLVDSNAFAYTLGGNRTFVWCLEGQTRSIRPIGWKRITDIYGNRISPTTLTENMTVFNGAGRLGLVSNLPLTRRRSGH